jgi:BirA family biotin operon repressor/biotin-[acetyl-CoA-carboxylase] ligase
VDLVVGVGLNVNHRAEDFPPELRERATSLHLASGRGMLELETVAAALLNRLGRVAARLAGGEWDALSREWESLAPAARGCRVRVLPAGPGGTEKNVFEGTTRGLDGDGALRVERPDGRIVSVRSAESVAVVE